MHKQCEDDISNRNCISGVRIEHQRDVVVIDSAVFINGLDYTDHINKKPYWTRTLYVKQATTLFKLVKGFGFRVLFGFRRIYVNLDPFFDNKVPTSTHLFRFKFVFKYYNTIFTIKILKNNKRLHNVDIWIKKVGALFNIKLKVVRIAFHTILMCLMQVQGICGRFNYKHKDEWTTPSDIIETKAGAFVKSYMDNPGSCEAQRERAIAEECPTHIV